MKLSQLVHLCFRLDRAVRQKCDGGLGRFPAVTGRVEAYRKENGLGPTDPVPVDAVTASGSGLDPDISVANARIQAKACCGHSRDS